MSSKSLVTDRVLQLPFHLHIMLSIEEPSCNIDQEPIEFLGFAKCILLVQFSMFLFLGISEKLTDGS